MPRSSDQHDSTADRRVTRGLEEHRFDDGSFGGGRPMPRGPLGTEDIGRPAAIGFCPLCGTNARNTTGVRGVYVCPTCWRAWYDSRVGQQTRSFDDYFSHS